MLLSIALGTCLAIVTIAIHAGGSFFLIGLLKKHQGKFARRFGDLKALSLTAVGLLMTHVLETIIWATAYFFVVGSESFGAFDDAVYFSTVTFTTLGYGDIVLVGPWRMLSAFQAMTGLLIFGWSTALLFSVVERIWRSRFSDEAR